MEALSIGGSLLQGAGGYSAAQANARADRANAEQTQIDATGQEQQVDMQARAKMGEQIAQQGAGGFQVGTGSNLDALTQSATNREMDLMNIRRQAQTKANAYTYQAGIAKMQGEAAVTKGLFGAASAMARGFSDANYQQQIASGGGGGFGSEFSGGADWLKGGATDIGTGADDSGVSTMSGYGGNG